MLFRRSLIIWLVLLSYAATAQVDTLHKPFGHQEEKKRLVLEVAAGYSATIFNFDKPTYPQYFKFYPYGAIGVGIPLRRRWWLKTGLFHQQIGTRHPDTYGIIKGKYLASYDRLIYANFQAMATYTLSKRKRRTQTDLLGGLFWGRLLGEEHVSIIEPDHLVSSSRSYMTYKPWNGGVALGLTHSLSTGQRSRLGISLIYYCGVTNILKRIATEYSGHKRYTRSVSLVASFSF